MSIYESDRNMPLGSWKGTPTWVTELPAQEKANHAIQMRDVMLLRDALAEGANLHDPTRPLLPEAAQRRHTTLCEYLLVRGAKSDFANSLGQTAAYFAAQSGERELLEHLGANGADLFKPDHTKTTPLMMAAFYGHLGCIEFLVEQGANVNERDHDGLSVLGYARHGRLMMLERNKDSIQDFQSLFNSGMISEYEQDEAILEDRQELRSLRALYAQVTSFLRRNGAIDCNTPLPGLTRQKKKRPDEPLTAVV